ncbi:hypothetical protein [Archangium lansingense]|uniref:Uncharacterized protein n=1 Tax=Archangium lansingense TaxID=2995310 RepID=A0ABT3ZWS5_9BACT|nr:hypothetical protein [Archangium lansinium]MCY1073843.1 hypothetical protein [Archangium lansinium]
MDEVGGELVFHFWAQDGALTLLSWKRRIGGTGHSEGVTSLVPSLDVNLPVYVGTRMGEVVLTLRREGQGWRLHSFTRMEGTRPLEAKTLPVRRTGVTADTLAQAHAVASQLTRGLEVPEGGSASLLVEVLLDDDRVLGAETVRYESLGGSSARLTPPNLAVQLTQALLPFTQGVGPRTVRLRLEVDSHRAESPARWRVMEAETLRPDVPGPPALTTEHYALYERILREWREETAASFQQAGISSAEFLATWFIGSLALRGGFALFEAVAPRLAPILARGGSEAMAWFRSFLARIRPQEREKFQRLWMKAQTEGLSAAEKSQLHKLMERFEKLLDTKLDEEARKILRRQANADFYKLRPDLAKTLVDGAGSKYPVHHRIPLEHAHRFPEMNINGSVNLKALHSAVHERVNNVWTAFRPAGSKASAGDVRQVADIVDRHFQRWYDAVYHQSSDTMLEEAEKAALREVRVLLARIP